MANGTTVAASVYYSDTTTYTGNAGSKTNPYCIEDLYDLIENPYINQQPSGHYYYIVVNDIDMNDYDEYKYSPPLNISLYFRKIDFKNHELRNITFYNISSATMFKIQDSCDSSIHNLKLTNFISANSSVTVFAACNTSYYNFYFYNCDFSIYADTTSGYYSVIKIIMADSMNSTIYNVYCYNCIFNIKGNLSYNNGTIINDNSIYMYYCHIHLYIIKNLHSILYSIGTFTSSYITGDIYGSTCYNNSLIHSSALNKLVNSYINVNFHNTNPENPTPIYGFKTTSNGLSCGSTFFINKSKLEGFTAPTANIANYYELTDEECKDLSKLQEIGFLTL